MGTTDPPLGAILHGRHLAGQVFRVRPVIISERFFASPNKPFVA